MNKYRISGRAGKTQWVAAELAMDVRGELERRYNNLARRAGLPDIMHAPGAVCGDMHDQSTGDTHGVRDGHGTVTLERQ